MQTRDSIYSKAENVIRSTLEPKKKDAYQMMKGNEGIIAGSVRKRLVEANDRARPKSRTLGGHKRQTKLLLIRFVYDPELFWLDRDQIASPLRSPLGFQHDCWPPTDDILSLIPVASTGPLVAKEKSSQP